jgi:hypothetical protein
MPKQLPNPCRADYLRCDQTTTPPRRTQRIVSVMAIVNIGLPASELWMAPMGASQPRWRSWEAIRGALRLMHSP